MLILTHYSYSLYVFVYHNFSRCVTLMSLMIEVLISIGFLLTDWMSVYLCLCVCVYWPRDFCCCYYYKCSQSCILALSLSLSYACCFVVAVVSHDFFSCFVFVLCAKFSESRYNDWMIVSFYDNNFGLY